jgi:hypothetical protein
LFLYNHALTAPSGAAVTLAGHEPESEIVLMRDYLRRPGSDVWFVDFDKSKPNGKNVYRALKRGKRIWPEANWVYGNLRHVLPTIGSVSFANLDFMGHLNCANVIPCLLEIFPRLVPGAVLGLTWERGREKMMYERDPGARTIRLGAKRGRSLNDCRWAGVTQTVVQLSDNELQPIGGYEYHSNWSPMSVSVFRKM